MVKWGNKQVKTHGPWGKARQEYHELEDEKLPLWSKKIGKKTWEMRHEARFSCMEIYKSNGNIYSDFENKFWVLNRVHFIHTI